MGCILSPSTDCGVRFWLSRSACLEDRDVNSFLSCFEIDAVTDGWDALVGGTDMLNLEGGGGREISELAPIVGINPTTKR